MLNITSIPSRCRLIGSHCQALIFLGVCAALISGAVQEHGHSWKVCSKQLEDVLDLESSLMGSHTSKGLSHAHASSKAAVVSHCAQPLMGKNTLLIIYGQVSMKLVPSAPHHCPETVILHVTVTLPLHVLFHGSREQTDQQHLPSCPLLTPDALVGEIHTKAPLSPTQHCPPKKKLVHHLLD